ncbi:Gluconolactonase precursor [Synechococcus sp. MIT S9509]|nr:Gluconolactonase precursor [Synechococcus sp. MIT S9509]
MIKAQSDKVWDLLSKEVEVQRIATGFIFTEGPIWNPKEQHLLFSDIPTNICRKLTPDGQISEARNPSQKSNGLTYDKHLNLLACEHLSSSVVLIEQDGNRKVMASSFEGKELNSPNDICVRQDGSIYFTDPPYGRMPGFGKEREQDLGFQGVFRLTPNQDLQLAVEPDAYTAPNGLCSSPDESLLYINDSTQALIDVYNVSPDKSLSGLRSFAKNIGNCQLE